MESSESEVIWIERPLETRNSLDLRFEQCHFLYGKVKKEWDFIPMCRLWSIGYSQHLLVDWFASFPPELVRAFKAILAELQDNMVSRFSYLTSVESMRSTVGGESVSSELDGKWDDFSSCAFLGLRFDPKTQTRLKVSANVLQSEINCIHREELLARFANHDLTFGMSQIEFLCLVVDELLNSTADHSEKYYRQIFVVNGTVSAVLLHGSKTRTFNSIGQLTQAIPRPPYPPFPTR